MSSLVQSADSDQNEEIDYGKFAAFVRSANEDIDLDSNLHSTGEKWLRRDVTQVREIHQMGAVSDDLRYCAHETATWSDAFHRSLPHRPLHAHAFFVRVTKVCSAGSKYVIPCIYALIPSRIPHI